MLEENFIAADFGAGSGRVILGTLFNNKIKLTEVHRFENKIIETDTHIFWDLDYLFNELLNGLKKVAELGKKNILGIGIDTWGVDYALLNDNNELLNNPYVYRDSRTNGIMDEVFKIIPKKKIYEQTGIQFLQFNTIYQLFAELKDENSNLKRQM